jgi:hypothetical protein
LLDTPGEYSPVNIHPLPPQHPPTNQRTAFKSQFSLKNSACFSIFGVWIVDVFWGLDSILFELLFLV